MTDSVNNSQQWPKPASGYQDLIRTMTAGDRGCEIAASCRTCPLPQCKLDNLNLYNDARKLARSLTIAETYDKTGLDATASRFNISRRSVFRAKARSRDADHYLRRYAEIIKAVNRPSMAQRSAASEG